MSLSSKQVRFTSHNETSVNIQNQDFKETTVVEQQQKPIDLSSLLRENTSDTIQTIAISGTQSKTKKKTKKKTQMQKLKTEKKKLVKELKKVEKGIKDDSERKSSAEYSPYENRQRLARTTSEIHSKVKQLEEKLVVKEKLKREKIKKSFKTKIKTKTIKAGKQHNRLINMTGKLNNMKLVEEDIRDEIRRERSLSSLSTNDTSRCPSNTYDMVPLDNDAGEKWVSISDQSTCIEEVNEVNEGDDSTAKDSETFSKVSVSSLEMARLNSSLSLISGLSLEEKELKAQKLAKKYDFTRELRNVIHQHMISRSYSYSYSSIIPPYKHRKPKPMKAPKQAYNRNIYEEKINVLEYAQKRSKPPAKMNIQLPSI